MSKLLNAAVRGSLQTLRLLPALVILLALALPAAAATAVRLEDQRRHRPGYQ